MPRRRTIVAPKGCSKTLSRLVLFLLGLTVCALANPLEEGFKALDRGDYALAKSKFSRAKGEAGEVARARLAIALDRQKWALKELQSEGIPSRVTRLEALLDLRQLNRAQTLLQKLEALKHSDFPPPYDARFYWLRGRFQAADFHPKLARKNFREALRRSKDPKLILGIHNEQLKLALKLDDLEEAKEIHEKTIEWVDQVESIDAIASHLLTSSRLQRSLGQKATEALLTRTARELYLKHDNPVRAARTILASSYIHERRGDKAIAKLAARKAVNEMVACEDYEALPIAMEQLADLHFNDGADKSAKVKEIYENTIAKFPDGPDKQKARLNYGETLDSLLSDPEILIDYYKKVLEDSKDDVFRCLCHQRIAQAYKKAGRYDQAADHFDEALRYTRETLVGDIDREAHPYNVLLAQGQLAKSRHDYREATRKIHQAIDSAKGRGWWGGRRWARHEALKIAIDTYDVEEARHQFTSAFKELNELGEFSTPKRRTGTANLMISGLLINRSVEQDVIDIAESALGDYDELASSLIAETFKEPESVQTLLDSYERELEQHRNSKSHTSEASTLLDKALFLEAVGRLPEARQSLESCIKLSRAHKIVWTEVWARYQLTRVELRNGDTEAAVEEMTESAKLSLKMNPAGARFYHMVAGSLQRESGHLPKSLASFSQVIEFYPNQAWAAYYGRALVHEKLGNSVKAIQDLERATELVGQIGLSSKSVIKGALGRVLLATDRSEEGLVKLNEAHQGLLQHGSAKTLTSVTLDHLNGLKKSGRASRALEVIDESLSRIKEWQTDVGVEQLCQAGVSLALSLDQPKEALRFLQLSHSAKLMASVDLSKIRHHDAETEKLLKEVQQLKNRVVRLQEQSGQASDSTQRSSLGRIQTETREQFFSRLSELRKRDADFEALVQLGGSQLSAVQGLLAPDDLLVEYFPSENSLYLFVVTRSSLTIREVSVSRRGLEGLVHGFLQTVSRPNSELSSYQEQAKGLYELLLAPIENSLDGAKKVRIVPSGPLWKVPFAALVNRQGETLHQAHEISYVTSADIMRITSTRDRSGKPPSRPLLVSGAKDLSGAGKEIRTLARLFTRARTLPAQELDLERLQENIGGRDLLHIASHSVLHPDPEKTYIKLGEEKLQLEQVYGLELLPGSMVFLSSCQSAVGERNPGKEVTSLASAFSIAGASTVVASRWKIDDRATVDIVTAFYKALLDGKPRGQALRMAELQVAKKQAHPYYWAGFSLFGDPK